MQSCMKKCVFLLHGAHGLWLLGAVVGAREAVASDKAMLVPFTFQAIHKAMLVASSFQISRKPQLLSAEFKSMEGPAKGHHDTPTRGLPSFIRIAAPISGFGLFRLGGSSVRWLWPDLSSKPSTGRTRRFRLVTSSGAKSTDRRAFHLLKGICLIFPWWFYRESITIGSQTRNPAEPLEFPHARKEQ